MKFLQTKPQIKSMNFDYYIFYHTVFQNRDGKEQDEKYDNFFDIIPNHIVGNKLKMMYF